MSSENTGIKLIVSSVGEATDQALLASYSPTSVVLSEKLRHVSLLQCHRRKDEEHLILQCPTNVQIQQETWLNLQISSNPICLWCGSGDAP